MIAHMRHNVAHQFRLLNIYMYVVVLKIIMCLFYVRNKMMQMSHRNAPIAEHLIKMRTFAIFASVVITHFTS